MPKLPTIPMSPMPEFGYDPIPLILNGEKVHTLRKRRCLGRKEVTVKGKRTGIVLEFTEHRRLTFREYRDDEFAANDGFEWYTSDKGFALSPGYGLCNLLRRFYGETPATMWCSHFRLIESPKDNDNA